MLWKNLWNEKKWSRERWAILALLIGLVLITGVHFFSQIYILSNAADGKQLDRDQTLNAKLRAVENHLLEMEANMHNFILSDDRDFFRKFDREMLEAERRFNEIEIMLLKESPEIGIEFTQLKISVQDKINYNNELLDSFRIHGRTIAEQIMLDRRDSNLNKAVAAAMQSFEQAEGIDIAQSQKNNAASDSNNLILDNVAYLLGLGLLIFALIYLLRSMQKRMKLHEDLIKAKENVEKSAQVKEQFLANMSHEIRTPLQAILGYSNMLGKETLNDKQTQYVNSIKIAGENLLTIVNDILDVSKIESGMMRLEETPFSISGLMHSIENMFQPKVKEKNLYIKLYPNPSIPDILKGDPTRLTQILVNLISNAIKFTEEGGIDIYLKTKEQTPQKLTLQVEVKDSGIGISKDKLKNIFNRFEQADSKVTRKYGGSGLGLFIVSELVKIQGGQIKAQSELGKGSSFIFDIPYQIGDKQRQRFDDSGMIDLKKNFVGLNILVVEDNLMNQRVIGTFLSEWGMDYDLSENGKIAIEMMEQKPYDLVLMDVQMPEMDGYSATQYIRDNLQLKTPIIAMTAHAFAGEREKALSYGMNEYISKPIREEDLYRLIARFVPLVSRKKPKLTVGDKQKNALSPTESNGVHIDYNFLMESSNGKKEYLRSILQIFLEQAPKEIAILEKGVAEADLETIGKMAHSLKSTIGYVGLGGSLRPHLEQLEQIAKENSSIQQITPLVLKLKQLMEQAIEKVKTEALPLVEQV